MKHFNTVDSPELKLEQVSVLSPSGQPLIHSLSLAIAASGSKVGIVGASGSGKTTLLRLLNRLIDPSAGQIYWQGKPFRDYPAPSLRQQIMLVPQEPQLLEMTVEQTLAYPLQLQRVPAGQLQAQIQHWQHRLMIPEDWHHRRAVELSVGQRQWVCLTRALIAQPQILLLDEPTSALDVGKIEHLLAELRALSATVVMVSHQLKVVAKLCDRILWIDRGQLRLDQSADKVDWSLLETTLSQTPQGDWDPLDDPF